VTDADRDARLARRRARRRRRLEAAATAAGFIVGAVRRAAAGVAGLLLVSFGAWLAWHPAGYMVAGVLVLADVVWSQREPRARSKPVPAKAQQPVVVELRNRS